MSILVTGFEAFLGQKVNPSGMLLSRMPDLLAQGHKLLELPVSYEEAFKKIKPYLQDFDHVLMLGQAGGRPHISLEMQAFNLDDSSHPDETGDQRKGQTIIEGGAVSLKTNWPLDNWLLQMRSLGFPVEISMNAGRFVCNHLYYQVLAQGVSALFVHVPLLPEQACGTQKPFLAIDKMEEVVRWMISARASS